MSLTMPWYPGRPSYFSTLIAIGLEKLFSYNRGDTAGFAQTQHFSTILNARTPISGVSGVTGLMDIMIGKE